MSRVEADLFSRVDTADIGASWEGNRPSYYTDIVKISFKRQARQGDLEFVVNDFLGQAKHPPK